jgi:DNA polymerase III subunit epsilon
VAAKDRRGIGGVREIVLDTETTGLEPDQGHRIIEIGCVELRNRRPTGNTFQQYINPERDIPEEAFRISKISNEMVRDKPVFAKIVDPFLDFIGDAPLVIHNASFDVKFLNAELKRADKKLIPLERAIDTVLISRKRFPGAQASLDALCRRFDISLDDREAKGHGALLDCELLAKVYLELTGGRQPGLALAGSSDIGPSNQTSRTAAKQRPVPLPSRLTEAEAEAHAAMLKKLKGDVLWLKDAK